MVDYQLQIDNFTTLLKQYFDDDRTVKFAKTKPRIEILFPYEIKSDDLIAIIRAHCPNVALPEFNDDLRDKSRKSQDLITMSIVDGKFCFGNYYRNDNGQDMYCEDIAILSKDDVAKIYKPLHFLSTDGLDLFCRVRNKIRSQKEKDVFSAFAIHVCEHLHNQMNVAFSDTESTIKCIQVTHDMIDAGLSEYYAILTANLYLERGLEPHHLKLRKGDIIFERIIDDKMDYGFWTKAQFETYHTFV